MIFKNKKGDIFLPALVVITIVVFSTLAYYIYLNNVEREKFLPVGEQSKALIGLYSETQNAEFYAQASAKFAKEDALKILAENGGYAKTNACQRTEQKIGEDSLIIFNTCPEFDPESEYKKQFEISLKEYLSNYKSQYGGEINKDHIREVKSYFASNFEITNASLVNAVSTKNVQSLEIEDNQMLKDGTNMIKFKTSKYPVDYSRNDSYYEYQIKISLDAPNLKSYNELYLALKSCPNKIETCTQILKQKFKNSEILQKGSYLSINTKDQGSIRLLFDVSAPVPKKAEKAFSAV